MRFKSGSPKLIKYRSYQFKKQVQPPPYDFTDEAQRGCQAGMRVSLLMTDDGQVCRLGNCPRMLAFPSTTKFNKQIITDDN